MNDRQPHIDEPRLLKLEVASPSAVIRDTRKNIRWILGFLGFTVAWAVASTVMSANIINGFIVTSIVPDAKGMPVVQQGAQTLDYFTAFYFTVINMTTVGFGDIFPATGAARVLAMINAVLGVIMLAGFVSVVMFGFSPSPDGALSEHGKDASGPPPAGESGSGLPGGTHEEPPPDVDLDKTAWPEILEYFDRRTADLYALAENSDELEDLHHLKRQLAASEARNAFVLASLEKLRHQIAVLSAAGRVREVMKNVARRGQKNSD